MTLDDLRRGQADGLEGTAVVAGPNTKEVLPSRIPTHSSAHLKYTCTEVVAVTNSKLVELVVQRRSFGSVKMRLARHSPREIPVTD